jgi:hypothetical protein
MRAVFLGRITPTQTIAIDENNPTENAPIIDAWLAVGLWKIGFKTQLLCVAQPVKIRHVTAPFSSGASRCSTKINGS